MGIVDIDQVLLIGKGTDIPDFGESEELRGFVLELPRPSTSVDSFALPLSGWVVGRSSPVQYIEVIAEETIVWRLPINSCRDDVADQFPELPWAAESGFQMTVGTVKLDQHFDVFVQAVLEDGTQAPMARILGRREPLVEQRPDAIQPIMITALAGMGSTWITRVLGQHPAIMAYRPFEYEPRVVSYWTDVLQTLGEPISYMQLLRPELYKGEWWLGAERVSPHIEEGSGPDMERWVAVDQVRALASFQIERIEAFYQRAVELEGRNDVEYFAEQCWPNSTVQPLMSEIYPRAADIFLVRDFRDMICSIPHFDKKHALNPEAREFEANGIPDYAQYIDQELSQDATQLLGSWSRRSDNSYLLKYEDLVLRQEETFASLLEHLNLGSGSDVIEHMIESAMKKEPVERRDDGSLSVEESVGRWRRDLDRSLVERSEEVLGEALHAFGYS